LEAFVVVDGVDACDERRGGPGKREGGGGGGRGGERALLVAVVAVIVAGFDRRSFVVVVVAVAMPSSSSFSSSAEPCQRGRRGRGGGRRRRGRGVFVFAAAAAEAAAGGAPAVNELRRGSRSLEVALLALAVVLRAAASSSRRSSCSRSSRGLGLLCEIHLLEKERDSGKSRNRIWRTKNKTNKKWEDEAFLVSFVLGFFFSFFLQIDFSHLVPHLAAPPSADQDLDRLSQHALGRRGGVAGLQVLVEGGGVAVRAAGDDEDSLCHGSAFFFFICFFLGRGGSCCFRGGLSVFLLLIILLFRFFRLGSPFPGSRDCLFCESWRKKKAGTVVSFTPVRSPLKNKKRLPKTFHVSFSCFPIFFLLSYCFSQTPSIK
jgi:hypothetical protein